jgi:hypothetical protein
MDAVRRFVTAVVALVASLLVVERLYHRLLRERTLNWGATAEEATRALPGDELLVNADIVATRAITIEAPPAAVWPWLVQMGPGRAGAYTYDWIENLFGLNMHSADRIHPEWQDLEVGEVLRSGEDKPGMRVEILEPQRALVNRSEAGDWVWAFLLVPDNGSTRLISRNRISMTGAAAGQRLEGLVMEPGSLVMERKMLLGIKERAERLVASCPVA